jgi:hypothetical protein
MLFAVKGLPKIMLARIGGPLKSAALFDRTPGTCRSSAPALINMPRSSASETYAAKVRSHNFADLMPVH